MEANQLRHANQETTTEKDYKFAKLKRPQHRKYIQQTYEYELIIVDIVKSTLFGWATSAVSKRSSKWKKSNTYNLVQIYIKLTLTKPSNLAVVDNG